MQARLEHAASVHHAAAHVRLAMRGRPRAIDPQSAATALSKQPESGSRCAGSRRSGPHHAQN
eukprot:10527498-Alexandrium_andersonii.AAC.1